MNPGDKPGAEIQRQAKRAIREARPWLILFGRFGYIAKGVVYTLIGVLAVQAAIGAGEEPTGPTGALERLRQAPFGHSLLVAIAIGLLGYASWRFVQAIMDTENKGKDIKGIAVRVTYVGIGVVHTGFAIVAFALAFGNSGGDGDSAQGWTARLMSQPFGQWLVAIAGAVVFARGGFYLYRAYSRKFREKLKLREMSAIEEKWALRLGRMGYAARGVVFAIIGIFLVVAAIYADPHEARGIAGALDALAQQPWGGAMVGVVAVGLAAYGIFMFVEARYRRMVIT